MAAASDTDGKPKAWERIREQVGDGVRDLTRVREDLADSVGFFLDQLSRRIIEFRFVLIAGPAVTKRLFEVRSLAPGRRAQTNQ